MSAAFYILMVVFLVVLSVFLLYLYLASGKKAAHLDKQKNNYASIIDQANDAMFVIDIVNGSIHHSNPAAAALLGYARETLQKKTIFNLCPPQALETCAARIADVWEKGGLIFKDIPFVTAAGETVPVECSAKVAPFEGRPSIVIYARDIRERLRLEKEILQQKNIIEQKNKDITDSINYARGIQHAILPNREDLKKFIPDSFILFKPKDIVSGDFYWFSPGKNEVLVAAVDCTGHGVPGALMSMIGNSMLNEVVGEKEILRPSQVLEELRERVIKILRRQGLENDSKDGMDIAFCNISIPKMELSYAGAYNPLWIVRGQQLIEIKADKFPIGSFVTDQLPPFTNHTLSLQKGDAVYLFTDGYADQFGGPKGKKFKYDQFLKLLMAVCSQPMDAQKKILNDTIEQWRGSMEQVDDILVIGIKI